MFKKIIKFLDGYKTYIGGSGIGGAYVLNALTGTMASEVIFGISIAVGLVGMAHKVQKLIDTINE